MDALTITFLLFILLLFSAIGVFAILHARICELELRASLAEELLGRQEGLNISLMVATSHLCASSPAGVQKQISDELEQHKNHGTRPYLFGWLSTSKPGSEKNSV